MNTTYYWGQPDTTVSFCENKYDKVFWIAEYYNTYSAFPYIVFGMFFLLTEIKHIGITLIALGVSTAIMHATLRYYGQWLDECSMLTLSYSAIQLLNTRAKNWGYFIIVIYYFLTKEYFILFFSLFFFMQTYIVYQSFYKSLNWSQGIFINLYIICFLLATVCWVIDQTLCHYIDNIPFHAGWHVLSALGMFYGFLSFVL